MEELINCREHLLPEYEAEALIARALVVITQGGLNSRQRREDSIETDPFMLRTEQPILDPGPLRARLYLAPLRVASFIEALNFMSVDALVVLHNHFDFYNLELRRRVTCEALLFRCFRRALSVVEASAFVLSRGGLDADAARPFVCVLVKSLPRVKRYR
jgi:hypothetical protein